MLSPISRRCRHLRRPVLEGRFVRRARAALGKSGSPIGLRFRNANCDSPTVQGTFGRFPTGALNNPNWLRVGLTHGIMNAQTQPPVVTVSQMLESNLFN